MSMIRKAVVSADGLYRYRLGRYWGTGEVMVWAMLNPSTADANVDDPTIRRCMGFARREGYAAIDKLTKERDEALAQVRAKQSWIDGMKVDYAAAEAERDTWRQRAEEAEECGRPTTDHTELVRVLRKWGFGLLGHGHYDGCWRYHWGCAVSMAADVIEELEGE